MATCWLMVKVRMGGHIHADQTVGSSPGRPGWLLLAVAVPLPLRVCGRRGGEARGIAIDWVTGRSGPLTRWEERAQCTVRPPLAPRVSRRERCSAGTAPLKRGDWGNLVTPGPSGALAFGASSARARPRRTAATGPGGEVDGAGRQGARNGRALLCQPVSLSTFATWLCRRLLVRAVWACTRCLSPHWVAQLRLGLERKGD